jgi:hypothetical protein
MIANAAARRDFLVINVMKGEYVRQCVARIDAANAAFARRFEELDYEEERRCFSFTRRNKRDIRAANRVLQNRLAAAHGSLQRQAESRGFPERMMEYTLVYRRSVAAATKDFTDTIKGIHEEYMRTRERQRVHLALRVARWCAHCRLYAVGALISGDGIDARRVGLHYSVRGHEDVHVGLGTYVHVEDRVVYSQGCCVRYTEDGEGEKREETSVAVGGELGVRSIGRLEGYCWHRKLFSAIVWGKSNVRDDEMDEDELVYDIVVLGESSMFRYNEWDKLYSPVRQYILDRE